MKILAIDLGKVKSVACDYASDTGEHSFQACQTVPVALEALFVRRQVGSQIWRCGWGLSCRWLTRRTKAGGGEA